MVHVDFYYNNNVHLKPSKALIFFLYTLFLYICMPRLFTILMEGKQSCQKAVQNSYKYIKNTENSKQ